MIPGQRRSPADPRPALVRASPGTTLLPVLGSAIALGAAAAVIKTRPSVATALALLVGASLGYDRARGLGHTLLPGHLVARSGSLARRRVMLETPAIIGWTFTSTWFQRRVGLTTLVATMAGGRQAVVVLDVPETVGTDLARNAVPGLVSQFLA